MSTGDRSGAGPPEQLSHYQLGQLIGSGGMGMVYEATDRRDGSRVAVKLLHPQLSVDDAFRERFEREAHVAALLRSPYTIHLLDFGVADGIYFLVMEFIDGETVAEAIAEAPLPPDRALAVAISVARALEEAEARGVVHRDIKPENVMLPGDGMMKVADFGIARRVNTPSMTVTGGFIGTMAYAAPEQVGGEVDHRTDIYALGATLYCMLTGQPPFGGTALDVLQQHRDASLPMGPLEGLPDVVVKSYPPRDGEGPHRPLPECQRVRGCPRAGPGGARAPAGRSAGAGSARPHGRGRTRDGGAGCGDPYRPGYADPARARCRAHGWGAAASTCCCTAHSRSEDTPTPHNPASPGGWRGRDGGGHPIDRGWP